MKKLILSLAVILIVMAACQKSTSTVDIEAEKEAIIKVLNLEGEAFIKGDLEQILAIHTRDKDGVRMEGTDNIYKGFEDIKALYESYLENKNENNALWQTAKNTKENILIKVTGNTAWLVCDNIWSGEEDGEEMSWSNKQFAFFEKIDGDWKFSFNAFIPLTEN